MTAGARFYRRRKAAHAAHTVVIAQRIALHHLHRFHPFQAGALCNFVLAGIGLFIFQVAHIGDIPHIPYAIPEKTQKAKDDIKGETGASVAQVGIGVHGGTADVQSHERGLQCVKLLRTPV